MKTQITHKEYLQLLGLKTLADKHRSIVEQCEAAGKEIIGKDMDSYGNHWTDACWDGSKGLDESLQHLGIAVLPPESEAQ